MNKLEKRFGWLEFPGFLRFYALFHVMVFLLQFVNPNIGQILEFDRGKILSGEVWRIFTFLFASSRFDGMSPAFGMLFLFFMVMIAFMMSDALEGAWGVFRTSLFYYTGFLGLLIANFIYSQPMAGSGFFIYVSAFFAFATLFPKIEFLILLFFPVQVRWIAIVIAIPLLIGVVAQPLYIGFFILSFSNYLLWAGIPAMRGQAKVMQSAGRKKRFEQSTGSEETAFHRCKKCDRTEITDPELDFRMTDDGEEYCEDHLPS